jgi:hypothetical protein
MNLLLRVRESKTSHVSIDRSAFCSIFFARIFSHVRKWISKRRRCNIFIIELYESYDASNKRQACDESVVMSYEATKNEMSFLKMFLAWKKTIFAYDDVTIFSLLRFLFSKDWLWITSCDEKNALRSRIACVALCKSLLFEFVVK